MKHPTLEKLQAEVDELRAEVAKRAMMRLRYDNLLDHAEITTPSSPFYEKPEAYAMQRYSYFLCYECKMPYYGGEAHCGAAGGEFKPEELICQSCQPLLGGATECEIHGREFLEYKCRFCCSVAVWFCFGTTHFCDKCHNEPGRMCEAKPEDLPKCPAGPLMAQLEGDCPLGCKHPPSGEEFCLGCSICREARTF